MKDFDKTDSFYSYTNYLFDNNLSYGAKCILTTLLNNEVNQIWDLYEVFENDTEENINNYFQELVDSKYVKKIDKHNTFVPFTHPYDELLNI